MQPEDLAHPARTVVVVDDVRTFVFDAVYARTSAEGLALLARLHGDATVIDELWLDHDLGGDDTTIPIVDWLCERAVWDDPVAIGRVVVHSSNPSGAAAIARTLSRWYDVGRVDPLPLLADPGESGDR